MIVPGIDPPQWRLKQCSPLGEVLVNLGYITADRIKPFLRNNSTRYQLDQFDIERLDSPEFMDFYRLQSQIKFALFSDTPLKTILITSALPSEGKTLCSSYLAMITAVVLGKRVLLLDTDLRYPSLHSVFHLSNAFGLSDVLIDSWPVLKAIRKTRIPNLQVRPGELQRGPRQLRPHLVETLIDTRELTLGPAGHTQMALVRP